MKTLKELTETERKYLDKKRSQIAELEKQQESVYNETLEALQLPDSDGIFDYLYNNSEFEDTI